MLDNTLKHVRHAREQGAKFGDLGRMLILVALLVTAWLILSEVREGRADIGQGDRSTPIQREIERQRQRLSSSDIDERRDALMRLGNLKRPEASRAAVVSLNDRSETVRVAAAHAVLSLPASEAASVLVPLLKDKSEFVRREAAFALGEARDRSAVRPLVEMLRDKKASVRAAAAIALGNLGDEAAVAGLSEILTGGAPRGKESKNSDDDFVRRSAAKSLGQIHNRAAVPVLIQSLENLASASDTRREAATSLGLIGDSSALPALHAALESANDPYLAEATRAAIKAIERHTK